MFPGRGEQRCLVLVLAALAAALEGMVGGVSNPLLLRRPIPSSPLPCSLQQEDLPRSLQNLYNHNRPALHPHMMLPLLLLSSMHGRHTNTWHAISTPHQLNYVLEVVSQKPQRF